MRKISLLLMSALVRCLIDVASDAALQFRGVRN